MAYKMVKGTLTYWRVNIARAGVKVDRLFHSAKEANRFQAETVEAIKNGTYLDPATKHALIPDLRQCLADYLEEVLKFAKDTLTFNITKKNYEHKLLRTIPDT